MLADHLYGQIILVVFMAVCAVTDLIHRQVDRRVSAVMLILSAGGYIWMLVTGRQVLWISVLTGISVGVLILLISIVTRGNIGIGDAVFFGLTGLVLGSRTFHLFAGSILLCACVSLVICAAGIIKGDGIRNRTIPFIPIVLPVGTAIVFLGGQPGLG